MLCLLVKAYLNVSYRRLTGFLRVLRPYLLSYIPHFNTLAAYNRMPSMEGEIYPWIYGRECMEGGVDHRNRLIWSAPPLFRLMEEQQVQGREEGLRQDTCALRHRFSYDTGCKDWRRMA